MDVQGEVLGWSFGIYECAQTKHFHRFYCTSVIFAASCCEPANQIPLNFISTSRMCSVCFIYEPYVRRARALWPLINVHALAFSMRPDANWFFVHLPFDGSVSFLFCALICISRAVFPPRANSAVGLRDAFFSGVLCWPN
jgi:hypothetical protein